MFRDRGIARYRRGTSGKARECPDVTCPRATAFQRTPKTGEANDNENEDKQPVFGEDGGVIVRNLLKRKRFDFVEVIVRRDAINVKRRKGGSVNGI